MYIFQQPTEWADGKCPSILFQDASEAEELPKNNQNFLLKHPVAKGKLEYDQIFTTLLDHLIKSTSYDN